MRISEILLWGKVSFTSTVPAYSRSLRATATCILIFILIWMSSLRRRICRNWATSRLWLLAQNVKRYLLSLIWNKLWHLLTRIQPYSDHLRLKHLEMMDCRSRLRVEESEIHFRSRVSNICTIHWMLMFFKWLTLSEDLTSSKNKPNTS